MRGRINKDGIIHIQRGGEMRLQYCPFFSVSSAGIEPTVCGDWCPLFGDPVETNPEEPYTILDICRKQLVFEELIDERSGPLHNDDSIAVSEEEVSTRKVFDETQEESGNDVEEVKEENKNDVREVKEESGNDVEEVKEGNGNDTQEVEEEGENDAQIEGIDYEEDASNPDVMNDESYMSEDEDNVEDPGEEVLALETNGASEAILNFEINQLGFVVEDLEKTVAFLGRIGIGPFSIIEVDNPLVKARLGYYQQGRLQIELIQIIEGATIHTRFLEEKGEGLHHVGCFVDDFDSELQKMENIGIEIVRENDIYGSQCAYLNAEKECGFILEFIRTR
ncbi:MAG: hypothetical protein GY866_36330 [Proteobacteria bacterium]|nr:hypothetical protein [Pseudomonadota bacterium]